MKNGMPTYRRSSCKGSSISDGGVRRKFLFAATITIYISFESHTLLKMKIMKFQVQSWSQNVFSFTGFGKV